MKKIALLIICIIALSACEREDNNKKKADVIRPAKVAKAISVLIGAKKVFPGITEASRKTELAFRVGGQIIELPVRAGQTIQKGQLIARLDETPYKNLLADRKAKFELARLDLERQEKLFKKNHVAKAKLDVAKSNFEAAKVALKRAEDDLGYTKLTAPFDGLVSRVNVDNFKNVSSQAPIAMFQGIKNIDIVFNVPESLFLKLNRNNTNEGRVDITFDALPDRKFEARYREHETVPDQTTRSFKVTVSMPLPKDLTVLPGMTVSVHVDLRQVYKVAGLKGVLIPVEAVFEDAGKTWVWKLDKDNAARKTEVKTHGIQDQYIRVSDGLVEEDRVIAVGTSFVREGQKVRPIKKERGL